MSNNDPIIASLCRRAYRVSAALTAVFGRPPASMAWSIGVRSNKGAGRHLESAAPVKTPENLKLVEGSKLKNVRLPDFCDLDFVPLRKREHRII